MFPTAGRFEEAPVPAEKNWWRGAVIYQIYPRSFQDNNGDGVGDLVGITQRLEYVADLGVDAIWLSPFFKSPMKDFGYDVSNYREVDPIFGTLEDFDQLVARAHGLGLKVIIDQVISHTSDQHPWFVESRQSNSNARDDWYIWADAKPDGTPPNNWLSIFGGSAWTWDPRRRQYYLHNFLASQPDLNFHNPAVQDAVLEEMRFWLERGVDGFRLDTVNFYFCSAGLEPNPPIDPDKYSASIAPDVNPYNLQSHLYDKSQPENVAFLERFRALLDEYPGTTSVGEIGDAEKQMQLMSQYTSGDKRLHMAYTFDFLGGEFSAEHFKEAIEKLETEATGGWTCLAFSNHDVVRHVSRWARHGYEDDFARLSAAILLSMRGSVCLYQGEELGLTEADISFEDIVDPYGREFWPNFKGRDGCRTPMVWQANAHNAGFSPAERSWLPIPVGHKERAVDEQSHSNESILYYYKAMLQKRQENPALTKGSLELVEAPDGVLAFIRELDGKRLLCAFNMTHDAHMLSMAGSDRAGATILAERVVSSNGALHFEALGAYIGEME